MLLDRKEAGLKLSKKLRDLDTRDALILAIPRGGVVVGFEISQELNLPLDVLVTKKIPSPLSSELAIGALGPDGVIAYDQKYGFDQAYLEKEITKILEEVKERERKFRGLRKLNVKGKKIILVDDGIATGYTVEAAILWLKEKKVKEIILAVPVMPAQLVAKFADMVDYLVYLEAPDDLNSIGEFL